MEINLMDAIFIDIICLREVNLKKKQMLMADRGVRRRGQNQSLGSILV